MLTDDKTQKLVPFVLGDNYGTVRRSGPELVLFFNQYGLRDVYDNKGGLPKLRKDQGLNTSRKDYTFNRLRQVTQNDAQISKLLSDLINTSNAPQNIADHIDEIIKQEGFIIEKVEDKYVVSNGYVIEDSTIMNEVTFTFHKRKILSELDKAKIYIWLAMAWFTEEAFAEKLKEKRKQGVDVQIVIYKDGVNAKHGVNLEGLDVRAIRGTKGGIMHNKFCIIDNQIVISGSYNWSKQAESKNDETVTIDVNPKLATEFSLEFKKLRNNAHVVQ